MQIVQANTQRNIFLFFLRRQNNKIKAAAREFQVACHALISDPNCHLENKCLRLGGTEAKLSKIKKKAIVIVPVFS